MSDFSRVEVPKWHDEVPGTRWFRADLHLHTLDDAAGGSVSWQAPPGIANPNDPIDDTTRQAYVRCFLKAAVCAGIEVLGLTPHSAHVPGSTGVSVVWDIVEAWQNDIDDDGVPYKEKIYAIFPGFEPSASDGKGGIHLLILFDPEIGKSRYIKAFTIATGGQDVWRNGQHQTSTKDAKTLINEIHQLKVREGNGWDFLCIGPHAFSSKGIVDSLKGDLGKYFTHGLIAALELKENQLYEDAIDAHAYLEEHLERHCQSLIHSSDAYALVNNCKAGVVPSANCPQKKGVGYRYTLVKLASGRIESLRQAFLSSDSRLRAVYRKDEHMNLQFRDDVPSPIDANRPWLRLLAVEGGTSFFGGKGIKRVLRFSPDLTCIIGGRMSGKSTLLDGMRTYCQIAPPQVKLLADDVAQRSTRFLSGNPTLTFDIVSPVAGTLPFRERWPARFFTQRELASIAKDADNVQKVLYHLAPSGGASLFAKEKAIAELDDVLKLISRDIADAHTVLAEKEQAFMTAKNARKALEVFNEAGAGSLAIAQADQGRVEILRSAVNKIKGQLSVVVTNVRDVEPPALESVDQAIAVDVQPHLVSLSKMLTDAEEELVKLVELTASLTGIVNDKADSLRVLVQKNLVDQGRKAEDLNQFDALSKLASTYESSRVAYDAAKTSLKNAESEFEKNEDARRVAITEHREMILKIIAHVNSTINNIRVSLLKAAKRSSLDEWIKGLKEPGITRWWNENTSVSDPAAIYGAFSTNQLSKLGMSDTVATRFKEQMTMSRKYELRSMRSDDKCQIEVRVGAGENDFRHLSKLSGGKQISVILSLLLESSDTSPLIIDQPEDELDKAFLSKTLLPILRRLKGKRQIIFATHDANVVVNGDADQVIYLESDAENASIKAQDAIDNLVIRRGILSILDGGKEAFDLRKRKYGF